MKKICLNCKREFKTLSHTQPFCCKSCREELRMRRIEKFQSKISGHEIKIPLTNVEQGNVFDTLKRVKRTEDFWIFSHAMFWHTQDFHEGETNKFKRLIAEYFKKSTNIDQTFTELIERACLAKRYAEDNPARYIPQPEDWFNANTPNGFAFTSKWHDALKRQRQNSPDFNRGLSMFAEAVINYADTRNMLDIVFYRHVFISLTHYDLLQWYLNIVMHYQFINY